MQDAIVRHFERVADHYGRLRDIWPLGALRRSEQHALRKLVQVRAGERVLDAGCGNGETLAWLARCSARAIGVDMTPAMASVCKRRGFTVCVQNMERLGMRAVFDWVLCVGALEFTATPAAAIRNLADCLRPDGQLALLFPRRGPVGTLYSTYHRTHGLKIHLFTHEEVRVLLADAGLQPGTQRRGGWLSSVVIAKKPTRA